MRDWTEQQTPPPSWHKDIICDDGSDSEAILTAVVRKWYLNHLKSTLEQNYALYSGVESECDVDFVSQTLKLERRALRQCMLASLYQRSMLTMINSIKQSTSERKLYSDPHEMESPCVSPSGCLPSEGGPFLTPPADYPMLMIKAAKCDPEVSSFEETVNLGSELLKSSEGVEEGTPILEGSFKNEQNKSIVSVPSLSLDESSSEPSYDWNQIEKEMARVCGIMFNGSDSDLGKILMDDDFAPAILSSTCDTSVKSQPCSNGYDWETLRIKHENELEKRWEEIRKKVSLERQAKLKRRIVELFGEDDLVMVDQSTEITEREAANYRERIAPWIVKHLMPKYKEKKISSRILFKKLAKHIVDCLIQRNRTPDECDVWMGVQEFFQHGKGITSEADIFY